MTKEKQPIVLITGSAGLVGSTAVKFFLKKGYTVVGVDNDMRRNFFGSDASVQWMIDQLHTLSHYRHYSVDITDKSSMEKIFQEYPFTLIIHAAAQPSHDWAVKNPTLDFSVNASATLSLLELFRQYCPAATFIFTSTNKVYGAAPNKLPFVEEETRYELSSEHQFFQGIDESMSIDQTTHSLFGCSKTAADLYVQEYGRYFGLNTILFRCGCLTGPGHSGTQLHGFLSFLVKSILQEQTYTIHGYKGKQVRDNIHAEDLCSAFYEVAKKPPIPGSVFNMGGSRESNVSLNEAVKIIEDISGQKAKIYYSNTPRVGDHIWYISNVNAFKKLYPQWRITQSTKEILVDIIQHSHFSDRN